MVTGERLDRRPLGKTGECLSLVGFGGLVVDGVDQKRADEIVAEAFEVGVNYYDVAPSYGIAEERLGPALKPYRDEVFLACKTGQRDKKGAQEELEQSLKRLKTDHLDLYQLHGVYDVKEDVERALGPGGAIEAFLAAREKGLIRFIGFSTHSVSAALRAIEEFPFDTVLCPINYVCHYTGKFDQKIVEAARNKNMGILAIKALAQTLRPDGVKRTFPKCWYLPISDMAEQELALRWTLSQPITAAVSAAEESLLRRAVEIALRYEPLGEAEVAKVRERAQLFKPIFQYGDGA